MTQVVCYGEFPTLVISNSCWKLRILSKKVPTSPWSSLNITVVREVEFSHSRGGPGLGGSALSAWASTCGSGISGSHEKESLDNFVALIFLSILLLVLLDVLQFELEFGFVGQVQYLRRGHDYRQHSTPISAYRVREKTSPRLWIMLLLLRVRLARFLFL